MFKRGKKNLFLVFLVLVALSGAVFSFRENVVRAEDSVDEIEDDIKSIENKLKKEQNAKAVLEAELLKIQNSVSSTQDQIDKARKLIKESEENISRMENEVESMGEKIDFQKEILKNLMREIYLKKTQPLLSFAFFRGDFAKIFGGVENYITIENKIVATAQEIKMAKEKVENEQEEIAEAKEDHEKALKTKVGQQYALLAEKAETQGDIAEKEATIGELRQKLAELQADIAVLTGKSYDAKDIQEAIEFASKETGVPKGVLYGFLTKETALGTNTGQCYYEKKYETSSVKSVEGVSIPGYKQLLKSNKKWQDSIDRLYDRMEKFYGIVDKLGYGEKKKVSCTIPFSKAGPNQGGAMGVAQFMSDTWLNSSLQSQIKSFTGHSKPDPWSLTDGVMAMGIKVRDLGGTSTSSSAIKKATIGYYGAFSQGYYDVVYYWAKNYNKLFGD